MIKNLLFIILLQIGICSAQNKKCFCDENKLMNEAVINCDTIRLKNNCNIYWQFNCNKIWLTLETKNKSKIIINEVDTKLYAYTYRIGYQVVKDYPNSVLFRSGCPANGPCKLTLINKKNGKIVKECVN